VVAKTTPSKLELIQG